MKKIVVIMLSIVMVFALIAVTACAPQATTVRIKLYVTADSTPIERNHTIGQDDLPAVTNGNLTFKGWYYVNLTAMTIPILQAAPPCTPSGKIPKAELSATK